MNKLVCLGVVLCTIQLVQAGEGDQKHALVNSREKLRRKTLPLRQSSDAIDIIPKSKKNSSLSQALASITHLFPGENGPGYLAHSSSSSACSSSYEGFPGEEGKGLLTDRR